MYVYAKPLYSIVNTVKCAATNSHYILFRLVIWPSSRQYWRKRLFRICLGGALLLLADLPMWGDFNCPTKRIFAGSVARPAALKAESMPVCLCTNSWSWNMKMDPSGSSIFAKTLSALSDSAFYCRIVRLHMNRSYLLILEARFEFSFTVLIARAVQLIYINILYMQVLDFDQLKLNSFVILQ